MAFRREVISDLYLLVTSVENMFLNEYIATSPGNFVKVYLIGLMYLNTGAEITNAGIANNLGIEEEDVLKAWNYWENQGIIKKHFTGEHDRLSYDVEFLSLKEQLYGSKASKPSQAPEGRVSMADKEIQDMIITIEKILGGTMNGTEVNEIISWINDYHTSPDVIIYAYKYSVRNKKKNVKYIEAVIRNWAEEGLCDVESIEKKLSENDMKRRWHKRVFQALGFNRNATEAERKIMNTWFEDMGFSMERVLEACQKTTGISTPNINYVNKVLCNWKEEENNPKAVSKNNSVTVGEVNKYYELLRKVESEKAERSKQEVYRKVPRIKEIEDELNSSAAEMTKLIISDRVDKQEAMNALKEQTESLNIEEAFLLTDNGFQLDYMDVKYQCDLCQDTGMLETGERCQCFGQVTKDKIDLLMKQIK